MKGGVPLSSRIREGWQQKIGKGGLPEKSLGSPPLPKFFVATLPKLGKGCNPSQKLPTILLSTLKDTQSSSLKNTEMTIVLPLRQQCS